jgi:hypothetical protein
MRVFNTFSISRAFVLHAWSHRNVFDSWALITYKAELNMTDALAIWSYIQGYLFSSLDTVNSST